MPWRSRPAPFLPRQSTAERTLWLWFGALFLIALFLIAKPRTHVYVFFMPWALLAGMVIGRGWRRLARATTRRTAMAAGVTVATLVTLLLAAYPAQLFAAAPREVYRTWAENKPAGYWTPYAEPINSSLFGLPTRNGWKALGAGYADGSLRGPYETNDFDEWVTYWYSRGAERCWRDHAYLAVGDHSERKRQAETAELLAATAADHARMTTVTVERSTAPRHLCERRASRSPAGYGRHRACGTDFRHTVERPGPAAGRAHGRSPV